VPGQFSLVVVFVDDDKIGSRQRRITGKSKIAGQNLALIKAAQRDLIDACGGLAQREPHLIAVFGNPFGFEPACDHFGLKLLARSLETSTRITSSQLESFPILIDTISHVHFIKKYF